MDALLLFVVFISLHCFVLFLFFLLMLVCYDVLMWHFLISINILNNKIITSRRIESSSTFTGLSRPVGRVSAPRNRRSHPRFDPGPRYTKVVKWYSLGTQTSGVELGLIDPISGSCDWMWYHVKCLGHDTSLGQY